VIGQSMSVALTGTVFVGLGGAVAGTLLASQRAHPFVHAHVSALQSTFTSGFHAALLVCALFAALGVFTSLARGEHVVAARQPS
ncbi:MAG: MFS transporter, partial [Ktedonobacteraceae bacterium]|nr:MFS transporter [Ktedonobacteraceae bacterium]